MSEVKLQCWFGFQRWPDQVLCHWLCLPLAAQYGSLIVPVRLQLLGLRGCFPLLPEQALLADKLLLLLLLLQYQNPRPCIYYYLEQAS